MELDSMYESEEIRTGVTLFRIGKMRFLQFEGGTCVTAGSVGTLDIKDRPSITTRGIVCVYHYLYVGWVHINTSGHIAVEYATSIGSAVQDLPTDKTIYGQLIWFVN